MSTHNFLTLPVVRILYAGEGMVNIFFVLSGFVLSYSTLRKIHSGNTQDPELMDKLITSLSSATLRRGIRLWGPMIAIWMMTLTITWLLPIKSDPPLAPTFAAHLRHFWLELCKVINPYDWIQRQQFPQSMGMCWSLAVEYRLSMVLFFFLLVTCKLTTLARKSLAIIIAAWSMYIDRRWDIVCVLAGFIIAEFRFVPLSSDMARLLGRPGRPLCIHWAVQRILFTILLLLGLMLCSVPEFDPWRVWPYKILMPVTPAAWLHPEEAGSVPQEPGDAWQWYYATYGAICVIYALENLPLLQRVLTTRVFIYLGEISFSYYLLNAFSRTRVAEPVATYLMDNHGWSKLAAWWAEFATAHGVAFVVGDYLWRTVDVGCVKLGHIVVTDFLGVGKKTDQPQLRPMELSEGVEPVIPR